MEENLEKSLKRYLKRKIKITLGFIVAFLITGITTFSNENYYVEVGNFSNLKLNGESLTDKQKSEVNFSLDGDTFINNEYLLYNNQSGWYDGGLIISCKFNNNLKIINNGQIIGDMQKNGLANKGYIKDLINNGYISGNHAISNTYYATKINNLENYGFLNGGQYGIYVYKPIDKIKNTGYMNNGIFINSDIQSIFNKGVINAKGNNAITGNNLIENPLENNGIILGNQKGISVSSSKKFFELNNKGIVGNKDDILSAIEIANGEIKNQGIITVNNDKSEAFSIGSWNNLGNEDQTKIYNYGVIVNPFETGTGRGPRNEESFKIYGLIVNNKGEMLEHNFYSREGYPNYENELNILKNKDESKAENTEIDKTIINAGSDENGLVKSIQSSTIKNLTDKGYILNGYDKTVVINSETGDKNIKDSIINGIKTAVSIEGENILGLENTIVNGGYDVGIILGNDSKNTLNLSGESIINGNIDLKAGDDKITLDNKVQINGTLDGGEGNDILTFNKNSEENINILHSIKGFENTSIDAEVTLFEKTFDDKGEVKNLDAQLGNITIGTDGNLNLRVDGTVKTEEKITGHALIDNTGTISSNGGKLNLKTYGFGEEEVIAFNNTDISGLKDSDITISSILHEKEINTSDNIIIVSAKKDLEDLDITNYEKLNKIYHSVITSKNLDKFNVSEEQYGDFLNYVIDIYAGNPYAYSSELSRKTMGMMKNLADKNLKPDVKEWAIYGGLTHVDGGTEETYYGKGYYTYDIGSRDIETDTKISGGYFKAEYGKSDTVTTGIIFGGNNSETEIGASKVEGDSFYFGTYAKKYLNNFRLTLGAGFEHGDYKASRKALGYRITTQREFSENYHDRGFNIYADTKYSKEFGNGLFIEPSFTLEYSYIDQDGVTEDGSLAIETDSKNFDYASAILNLDLRKVFKGDKFTNSLIVGVSYERMLAGYDEEYITGRMVGGTDFDILVPEKEKDIFSLNAKYELETEKGFIFDAKGSYRFENGTDKSEWIVGTGVGYRF